MTVSTWEITASADDAHASIDETTTPPDTANTSLININDLGVSAGVAGFRFLNIGDTITGSPSISAAELNLYANKGVNNNDPHVTFRAEETVSPATFNTSTRTPGDVWTAGTLTTASATWDAVNLTNATYHASPDLTSVIDEWFTDLTVGAGADIVLLSGPATLFAPTVRTATNDIRSAAADSTSVTVNSPANAAAGDSLYCLVARGSNTAAPTAVPTDWVLTNGDMTHGGAFVRVYRKDATASEPSSYTWTWAATDDTTALILCVTPHASHSSNTGIGSPVVSQAATGSDANPDSPELTGIDEDTEALVISFANIEGKNDYTNQPSGYTWPAAASVSTADTGGPADDHESAFAFAAVTVPSAGTVNPGSWTASLSDSWGALTVVVAAASRGAQWEAYDSSNSNEPQLEITWAATKTGTAAGDLALSGAATASAWSEESGTAAGDLVVTGTATGLRTAVATAAGNLALAGAATATNWSIETGTAAGDLVLTGAATGSGSTPGGDDGVLLLYAQMIGNS